MECDRCGAKATCSVACWVGCEHLQCARCGRQTEYDRQKDLVFNAAMTLSRSIWGEFGRLRVSDSEFRGIWLD